MQLRQLKAHTIFARRLYSTVFICFCQGFFTKIRKTHKRNRMEVVNIYKYFIAEVKKQLSLKGWKYADLCKATGDTGGTIEAFMCGARESENMAKCISKVLGIKI